MTRAPGRRLTPRQAEVVLYAANGHSVAQTARHLGISSCAIKTHLRMAYRALGSYDRAQAVAVALMLDEIDARRIDIPAPRTDVTTHQTPAPGDDDAEDVRNDQPGTAGGTGPRG